MLGCQGFGSRRPIADGDRGDAGCSRASHVVNRVPDHDRAFRGHAQTRESQECAVGGGLGVFDVGRADRRVDGVDARKSLNEKRKLDRVLARDQCGPKARSVAKPEGFDGGRVDSLSILVTLVSLDREGGHFGQVVRARFVGEIALELRLDRHPDERLDLIIRGTGAGILLDRVAQAGDQHSEAIDERAVDVEQHGIEMRQRKPIRHYWGSMADGGPRVPGGAPDLDAR